MNYEDRASKNQPENAVADQRWWEGAKAVLMCFQQLLNVGQQNRKQPLTPKQRPDPDRPVT